MLKQGVRGFSATTLTTLFSPIRHFGSIGLAVSGGVDSLGLMLLVRAWMAQIDVRPLVRVYCVNHGLRREAGAECEMVKSIAQNLDFEFEMLEWRSEKPARGIQAAARRARYGLMGKAMMGEGVEILLTGHHLGDQAETVLMRMAHSSGVRGLGAMRAFSKVEGVSIFRPLLNIDRGQLERVVSDAGLGAVQDVSNEDEKYERVRWRKVMPMLQDLGLTGKKLSQFASRMGRANRALEEISVQIFNSNVKINHFGVLGVDQDFLYAQSEEIVLRVLSKMIYVASGKREFGELNQVETLYQLLNKDDFSGHVVGGCAIALRGGTIVAYREAGRADLKSKTLFQGGKTVWDQRIEIINRGNSVIKIDAALTMSRQSIEIVIGRKIDCGMSAFSATPIVRDEAGVMLAIGSILLSDKVALSWTGLDENFKIER